MTTRQSETPDLPDRGPDSPTAEEESPDSGHGADSLRRYAIYSGLAAVFPAAAVFGLWAGRSVAGWLGAEPGLGSVLGLLAGVAGAFYNLFAVIGRTERRADDDLSD